MENIIKGIRQYYPVSDSSLEVLFSYMKKMELPKKHLLIHGGVLDRHVYFIEKGFCRSYCLRDGEEITIWFSREGDITFAMKDLYHNQPGYEYVELLEDCELYAIRIEDLNQIYETNIEIIDYMKAFENLKFSMDASFVYNPSIQSVWLSVDGNIVEVKGGQTVYM